MNKEQSRSTHTISAIAIQGVRLWLHVFFSSHAHVTRTISSVSYLPAFSVSVIPVLACFQCPRDFSVSVIPVLA